MLALLILACAANDDHDCAGLGTWYVDGDEDGYGDPALARTGCPPPTGTSAEGTDCDDGDPTVHPGAVEHCNRDDEDCDGIVDEDAVDPATWYPDADGDGFGDGDAGVSGCQPPSGTIADGADCDDADPAVNPGAAEACDGVDQDCDGAVDEGWEVDADGDGHTACHDCDDADATVFPGADDACDGVDGDCDGTVDGPYAVPAVYATVQEAVDAAPDGGRVCVGEGRFVGTVDLAGKDLVLHGTGADRTVLDGAGTGPVVRVEGGTVEVAGLTITGGDAPEGAGLRAEGADLALLDVRITGNTCAADAGARCEGVAAWLSGSFLVAEGLEIDGNLLDCTATDETCRAPGLYAATSSLELTDTVGRDNSAWAGGLVHGGALYITQATHARWYGGAIHGNVLEAPEDDGYAFGAAVFVDENNLPDGSTVLDMANVRVADNHATAGSRCGAAVLLLTRLSSVLTNVALTGNTAACPSAWGGALALSVNARAALTNVVIAGNTSTGPGAAIHVRSSVSLTLTNTVVSGNRTTDDSAVVYAFDRMVAIAIYSAFWDNGAMLSEGVADIAAGEGNVLADPLFRDTSASASLDWDLTLDATSPLIDAGDPDIVDLDGTRSDLGIYGGPAASW